MMPDIPMEFVIYMVGLVAGLGLAFLAYFQSSHPIFHSVTTFLTTQILALAITIQFVSLPTVRSEHQLATIAQENPKALKVFVRFFEARKHATNIFVKEGLDRLPREVEALLDLAAKGRIRVDREDIVRFSFKIVDSASKKITATSFVQRSEFWDTPAGRSYLKKNKDAIDRGVIIKRLFIFRDKKHLEENKKVLENQKRMGIDVWFALITTMKLQFDEDLILVDDNIAGRLSLTPTQGMAFATFYFSRPDIQEVFREFENVIVFAAQF